MTRYLPWEKLSPLEASEVPRASPSELPWLPREITFPAVDNGSYTPLRSDLSYTYIPFGSALPDLICAQGILSNGLGRIMHSSSARVLSARDRSSALNIS